MGFINIFQTLTKTIPNKLEFKTEMLLPPDRVTNTRVSNNVFLGVLFGWKSIQNTHSCTYVGHSPTILKPNLDVLGALKVADQMGGGGPFVLNSGILNLFSL